MWAGVLLYWPRATAADMAEASGDGEVMTSGEPEGRVIDALRRALGLATPPPVSGTADLLAMVWIEALIEGSAKAVAGGRELEWDQAAAAHPAMQTLSREGHDIDVEHVAMIAQVATAAWSWENLRLKAVEEAWVQDLVPRGLAEWMDEGMFARWLMAGVPPLGLLKREAEGCLPPRVWRQVEAVLAATGAGQDPAEGLGVNWRFDECRRRATPGRAHRPRATPRN
jgi:hypothetical protein